MEVNIFEKFPPIMGYLPESWNEAAIIILLYKKGGKTKCDNEIGISLLN